MTPIQAILWLIFFGAVLFVVLWLLTGKIKPPITAGLQREVDLRLTYKRYMQLYPSANISYEEYKRLQTARAYKKAVSSTKIKRMVR